MLLDSETTASDNNQLPKSPTGIQGLDEITGGGLPQGRPTLVCGTAGSGKTLIGLNFLVSGAISYSEPGVFVSFEETPEELIQNVRSLGWNLNQLIAQKKFLISHIHIDPYEIEETGDYNLEALFIRLEHLINAIAAKRIVLDTIETLFVGLSNDTIVRSELQRLFRWLKSKGVTAIITGEKGENTLTRHGLEEYVADCVIRLDQRIQNEISTRRLQIIKYRGSSHGTNEYPFLINQKGISVLPITSVGLDHKISTERISTGIPRLDTMLGGQGYFRGSSILITGTAGTGKSTISAHFAQETCLRGEPCLYLAFEEAPQQILRNMLSVGLDLHPFVQKGLLKFQAVRPTAFGLEMHLIQINNLINEFQPTVVIVDPMSNLVIGDNLLQSKSFFMRLIDSLKSQQITVMLTNLIAGSSSLEHTEIGISSLMDTWLELRVTENSGERNRVLYVLKSRGMEHSNQVREFVLTNQGIELKDVYLGQGTVLTGTARNVQEAKEKAASLVRQQEFERKRRELERKQALVRSQIEALQTQLENEKEEFQLMIEQENLYQDVILQEERKVADLRQADVD
ncbi:circadian clock protein KaiC [Phormidium sp. LEGE 05292]|uniref:circadian clock protein KaiC n=1 Tax=[Phormidium] sp. LEGE 05292 TaxID=767427 RepID=UPI001880D7AB|nr:circadian clock protein KaiC [Phormidium sp. LEGE 05292]MBE9226128.1 circadian clock protein KaiC [Phormidium sp. LEGE 05292]